MAGQDRVVVGVDGSPQSSVAVRWAARRALLFGVGLAVVRVVPQMPLPTRGAGVFSAMRYGSDYLDHVNQVAQTHVDEAVAAARQVDTELDITGEVITGEPAQTLADLSRQARLVVVGSTGASGVSGVLLGGTAVHVIAHAHQPLVVVPPTEGDPQGPVVVGLDDSPTAHQVAHVALEQAALTQRPLLAVHAWDIDASIGLSEPLLQEEEQILSAYDHLLMELTAQPKGQPLVAVQRKVVIGRAEKIIAELSTEASLVVVGSRGRGGFTGLLLGSVSRSVISHSACPTLVVRN